MKIILLFIAFFFIFHVRSSAQDCTVMVAVAWNKVQCKDGSFNNVAGAAVVRMPKGANYAATRRQAVEEAKAKYNADEKDIQPTHYDFPCVVIISYRKEQLHCSTQMYAVGYGKTVEEAELKAKTLKEKNVKTGGYEIVQTVTCSHEQ